MTWAIVFWSALGVVAWTYAGYPAFVALLARRLPPSARVGHATPPMTVIIAAWNEAATIRARVLDILAQDYPEDCLQVCVVSDGSTDDTAARAAVDDPRVRVIALPGNVGKAAALNAAVASCSTELLAFTDARQRFAPGALRALAAEFGDPRVGAASGELVIAGNAALPSAGTVAAVGLYWRMEKRLRSDEARLGWLHGVSGAIHAMRRGLFVPLRPGTILDDMWLPLHVAFAGHRVAMARDAVAVDVASNGAGEEFARKLRTLAGNWQLIARLPLLLHPLRNPVFFAWCSHKLLRLLAPWALLLALLASALAGAPAYRLAFVLQLAAYAWALAGLRWPALGARMPLSPAAGAFVVLNAAALLSLPASLAWSPARLWRKH